MGLWHYYCSLPSVLLKYGAESFASAMHRRKLQNMPHFNVLFVIPLESYLYNKVHWNLFITASIIMLHFAWSQQNSIAKIILKLAYSGLAITLFCILWHFLLVLQRYFDHF